MMMHDIQPVYFLEVYYIPLGDVVGNDYYDDDVEREREQKINKFFLLSIILIWKRYNHCCSINLYTLAVARKRDLNRVEKISWNSNVDFSLQFHENKSVLMSHFALITITALLSDRKA
jgi:hypothetical protein